MFVADNRSTYVDLLFILRVRELVANVRPPKTLLTPGTRFYVDHNHNDDNLSYLAKMNLGCKAP